MATSRNVADNYKHATAGFSRLDAAMARTILTLLTLLLVPPAVHAQSTWVKVCEKANAVTKDKDGKDVKKEVNICLTHHERLDEKGNVLLSAALRQIEGQDKQHFMVMVPLGMLIKPGMHAMIYPKDLWERIETNRGVNGRNEEVLRSLTLATRCAIPRDVPQRRKPRLNSSLA